jgi:hypothetical protein
MCGCDFFARPRKSEKVIEAWETTNEKFKVRVTAYAEENGGFVPGAYYVFESSPARSNAWREIMTLRHDDPVKIPREQVRFVNDKVGYAFMVYDYAVTTDGGVSWFVWNIVKDLPNWLHNRPSINDIRIAPDGSGTMTLTSFTNQEAPSLKTDDYGRHWVGK